MHIKRIPIKTLPKDEEGLRKWLFTSFQEKDKLLSIFKQEGHFPDYRVVERIDAREFGFPFIFWSTLFASSAFMIVSTFCWLFC